jgi:hypothetical protein
MNETLSRLLIAGSLLVCACSTRHAPASAPSAPPPSAGHALVYDDSLRAVLLVNAGLGGANPPPVSARTAIWRWADGAWALIDPTGPPVRNLGGVAYDSRRDRLVLFGGSYDLDHVYGETWEWAGERGWARIDAPGPEKRDHTCMAYDAENGRVVLFGGQVDLDTFPAETWTWDGAAWRRFAQPDGPSPRVHHTMAYDPAAGQVVLFGGVNPPSTTLGDTWIWSGASWSRTGAELRPRTHACLVPTSHGVTLFGGFRVPPLDTVPVLEHGAWRPEGQPHNPGPRYLTAAAYDPVREVTVLYGGGAPSGDSLYSDTWEFDSERGWRRVR